MLPILLNSPERSDLKILPLSYKQDCFARIKQFVDDSENFKTDPHFMGRYNTLEDLCLNDHYDPKLLSEFKDFTRILDLSRKQSLEAVNPKLWSLLEDE